MYQWTPRRAAWFGFCLGRGASLESVLRDRRIGAQSAQQLRGVATRWGLAFGDGSSSGASSGGGSSSLAVPIPAADQEILQVAAEARGLSAASFAADLLHVIARERLFNAVLDDDRD